MATLVALWSIHTLFVFYSAFIVVHSGRISLLQATLSYLEVEFSIQWYGLVGGLISFWHRRLRRSQGWIDRCINEVEFQSNYYNL